MIFEEFFLLQKVYLLINFRLFAARKSFRLEVFAIETKFLLNFVDFVTNKKVQIELDYC